MSLARRWNGIALVIGAGAGVLSAQTTTRASLDSAGMIGDDDSRGASISGEGRYVAFGSFATNLVPSDTNDVADVFVRDRQLGTTERISVDAAGAEGNGLSLTPSISADGRFVAFASHATNLVPGDTNNVPDVFVRDRLAGTIERVSVHTGGAQGDNQSFGPSISADGRYVAFESDASNLDPADTNARGDIFVRDRLMGTTEKVSFGSAGEQGDQPCQSASISGDGRYVAFYSYSGGLVPGDSNTTWDVFVRDRLAGTTERVSVDSSAVQGNDGSFDPSVSGDGRYVAFESFATNLVPGDMNGAVDVFVRDRLVGTTVRVSVDSTGVQGNFSSHAASISGDGRRVTFSSQASNLVPSDTNGSEDIFVRDLAAGSTFRASVSSSGAPGNGNCYFPAISRDGQRIAFETGSWNLVPGGSNGRDQILVRDLEDGPDFTSVCHPSMGGVIGCPCANPPGSLGRGCDNSSATGGAMLSAGGATSLSSDSLVLTTSGEKPTALSIVLQGPAAISAGQVFGQGVRCVGGPLKRLYTKPASGGSITAPSFGAGDPQVSVRSAAAGDPISAGQDRFYLVYYRDPVVLGGCPAASTFNATQGGRVTWAP